HLGRQEAQRRARSRGPRDAHRCRRRHDRRAADEFSRSAERLSAVYGRRGATGRPGMNVDERVLVWAPARDGRLTCGFLTEIGFSCVSCESWEQFRAELNRGVGAVVVAGEFLSTSVVANLQAIIEAQPAWSDLPVIV